MGFEGHEQANVDVTPQDAYADLMARTGVLVTGSGTYEWVMDREGDWPYELPTFLFTTREPQIPDGRDVRIVSGEVADHHADILAAAGEGDIWLIGGGSLAIQFQRAGLIDELHLTVVPVVLGEGIPTFAGDINGELELIGSRVYSRGMVELRFRLPGTD